MAANNSEKTLAPDFELIDTHGNRACLSDYRGRKAVVLVLLRGFV